MCMAHKLHEILPRSINETHDGEPIRRRLRKQLQSSQSHGEGAADRGDHNHERAGFLVAHPYDDNHQHASWATGHKDGEETNKGKNHVA